LLQPLYAAKLREKFTGSELGYGLALGTLDGDPGLRPERHVFVANKAPWFEITDDLPQHQGWPPVE